MTKINLFNRLLRLMRIDSTEITHIYIYGIFAGLLSLVLPLGVQSVINYLQTGKTSTSWFVIVFFVVLSILLTGWFQYMQMKLTEVLQQKIFFRSSFDFTFRLPRIQQNELKEYAHLERANRFFDTLTIQKGLPKVLIDVPSAILQIFFGLLLLSFYHAFFIAFSIFILLIVFFLLRMTFSRGVKTSLSESKYKYYSAYWLQLIARSTQIVSKKGEAFAFNKNDQNVINYIESREAHFKVLTLQFKQLITFKAIMAFTLLIVGGLLVINQQMNIGQFIAAEIIILLVASSIEKLIISMETIYDVLTGLEKLGEINDAEIKMDKEESYHQLWDNLVELEIVSNGEEVVELKNAKSYALISDNYNFEHVFRTVFLNIENQKIFVNGQTISSKHLFSYTCGVGGVLGDFFFYKSSILENLTLGTEVDKTVLVDLLRSLGLMDKINQLEEGLETIIHNDNQIFSPLDKQKIAIIRAYYAEQPVVFLNDLVDHLLMDKRLDELEIIMELFKHRMVIGTCKLKSSVSYYNQVLYVENGVLRGIKSNNVEEELKDKYCYA